MAQRNAVPLAGILKASFEDETKTRICVMIQADGSVINENRIRFHFKKITQDFSLLGIAERF